MAFQARYFLALIHFISIFEMYYCYVTLIQFNFTYLSTNVNFKQSRNKLYFRLTETASFANLAVTESSKYHRNAQ